MITTLFSQHLRTARRYFARERVARAITALAFLAVVVGLAVGIYFLFWQGLTYIAGFSFSATAVSLYMYELTLLSVMGLMFASALISGMSRLFQGANDFWIMASPSFTSLPWYVASNIFLSSLWPLIVIGLPALLAMNSVYHLSINTFTLAFLALGLLGVLTIMCALSLLLTVAWGLTSAGIYRPSYFITAIIGVFALGASVFWAQLRGISNVANLFPGIASPTAQVGSDAVTRQFQFFPSHPAAEIFLASQRSDIAHAGYFFVILSFFAVTGVLLFGLLCRKYLPLWQALQEHSFEARARTEVRRASRTFVFAARNPLAVLFQKEAITFLRNQTGLLWMGFLGLVWLLQIGFDVIISRNAHFYATDLSTLSASVQMLQVVVIIYFISMFVLRFVFPAFSIEKDTSWFIGSIPLSLSRVYASKLSFFMTAFVLLSGSVVLLHALILGMTLWNAALLFFLVACMTALVVLFGLSLGILFPNFETTDPEQLSTSLPGLTFIVCSLLYGSLGAFAFRVYLTGGTLSILALFVFASACAFGILHLLSIRALRNFEFGV